jgi:hypothetical protein
MHFNVLLGVAAANYDKGQRRYHQGMILSRSSTQSAEL